jgi:hypothetical protein
MARITLGLGLALLIAAPAYAGCGVSGQSPCDTGGYFRSPNYGADRVTSMPNPNTGITDYSNGVRSLSNPRTGITDFSNGWRCITNPSTGRTDCTR